MSFLIIAALLASPASTSPDPVVRYEFTVAAPRDSVWAAWTTERGLRSFFGPGSRIELRTFGEFQIQFDPNAKPGSRGAEGNVVLAFEPLRMLTTTWDAPPKFPMARAQRTFLQITLAAESPRATRVTIQQSGFGAGEEWQQVYRYFLGAWTWVGAALQYRFDVGPIDWSHPPDLLPRMKSIGGDIAVEWARTQG
ncbi:MAG: SRPBCC domain-containing protein [Gemmatimonadota bacterium]